MTEISRTYPSVREVLAALAEERINLKIAEADNIVYVKAWIIEDEILSNNPPDKVKNLKSPYRHQLISKTIHRLGFERQGRHNHNPLWKKVIA
jgi:hypothetical protein